MIIKRVIALLIFLLILPFFLILWFAVKITSKGPFIFKQKRAGKNKKSFFIYKIRTMVDNAEKLKLSLYDMNEADGPVFKIKDDPRYTMIGKILSHSGLDEIPQLINIIFGEMDFVGPRPLPVGEAQKIPKKYLSRFSIRPGMTSTWVISGSHKLSFDQWMRLDIDYAKSKSFLLDLKIIFKTIVKVTKLVIYNLLNLNT
jgi:lipopolysaccharide/colanic/teichoic acid biosynthesis glycosyltransferase